MLKCGGVKALTRHVADDLKCTLSIEDSKVSPQIIDNTSVISRSRIVSKPGTKAKVRMVRAKVDTKKSCLELVTTSLYDLETSHGPEKPLNIDLGLYQMEE